MVVAAARALRKGESVLVGVGLPNIAVNLANRVHDLGLNMIYESGVIGSDPSRLPLSIGDPCIVSGSQLVCSMYELFAFYLQGGHVDVGFLGGAQLDRYGNINSTVIGDYAKPKVRLPGSGGACEISLLAKRIVIITPHDIRRFPAKCDFLTSPGVFVSGKSRRFLGLDSAGPEEVITNLGVLRFDQSTGEMYLHSIHPGVKVEDVKKNTGWDVRIADRLQVTEEPSDEELRVIREELDPKGLIVKR